MPYLAIVVAHNKFINSLCENKIRTNFILIILKALIKDSFSLFITETRPFKNVDRENANK